MENNFKRKVLDNGMTILFEKRNLPIVSVSFTVRNGGINESEEEKGISHFIEHMLYKGTPTRESNQIAGEIENKGGVLNGFTTERITSFLCKMPSENLNTALEVLSDLVKNPLFDEKELEKERKVIFEEMNMRKDTPQIYVLDKIVKLLYEDPVGGCIIGTEDTLKLIDKDKIVNKFKEVYQPNNLILCVVGDANFEEIVSFAEKNFGDIKGNVPKFEVKLKNECQIEERKGIDQANLVFAHQVPLATDKKHYAAIVLNSLMTGGLSSRLFQEIREKRNLAYAIRGDADINKDFACNIVCVGTKKENVDKVNELILDEFKKVSEELSEEELKKIKDKLIWNHQISMEDSQAHMINLVTAESSGIVTQFYNIKENISNVQLEDVKNIAKDATEKYSLFTLVPK